MVLVYRTTQRMRFAPFQSLRASPHFAFAVASAKHRIRWERCT